MGYLLHLLVALLAQGLAEAGWSTGWRLPWLVLLLCAVPYALTWLAQREFLRGRFRQGGFVLRVLSGCAPALHLVAMCFFGWMDSLRGWLGEEISLAAWPRIGLLLALLPYVVYELASIDGRARMLAAPGKERRAWRFFQARMLVSGLVPLAAYVLISAVVGASETLRVEIEEVPLFGAVFAGVLLVLVAFFLPALLRHVWDTSEMPPGPQRDVLREVADKARFRARALLAWNTGDLMANAAIVGIGARTRIVLFSDSLLAQLDAGELAAVFAHEIGHAVRRHVLVFVAWAGAFFLFADLVANGLFGNVAWISGAIVAAAVVGWLLLFGYASRRFELDADLYCLDLLGDVAPLIRALEKVGGRFRDVASWRHFSSTERARFLSRAASDPSVGEDLRRNLRRWSRVGVALLLVAGAMQAWSLASSYPEDRLRADLCLGRYTQAAARAASIDGIDPHWKFLVERAASLHADRVPSAELERRARAALAAGDPVSAIGWLELGRLRGDDELGAVADVLKDRIEPGVDSRSALDVPLDPAWQAEIEACLARLGRADSLIQ